MRRYIISSVLFLVLPSLSSGFGVVVPDVLHASPLLDAAFLSLKTSVAPLISSYQEALHSDPLRTQVTTGVVLAIAGDAIAQQQYEVEHPSQKPEYDYKRAVSFASFDGVYRALQHFIYPPMIALCQGQLLSTVTHDVKLAAALEQALASQIIIIPVIYYPTFFAVTGLVQGLSARQTYERASSSFWPLMTRNWLFWIPVQFSVFNYIHDEAAQISILIACGLVWTVILSVLAGQAKEEQPPVVLPEQPPELEMERVMATMQAGSNNTAVFLQAPSDVEMDMEMEFRA
jgi:hypothetical protein